MMAEQHRLYLFGKELRDWQDIYCLLKFAGHAPKSLKDLYDWKPPLTPNGCLELAFVLIEARKINADCVAKWLEEFLRENRPHG